MAGNPTVYERMIAVIDDLPAIGKTQRNVQQNFMFRGHDDVLNALNPLLAKHGVFVIPDVIERVASQRTTSRGSVMYEVNLHVRFTFYGAGGDHVTGSGWGEGTDMGDKATSKAMTMAFKYVLAQAFAVSTEEAGDPDADTPEETVVRSAEPPPAASDEDREALIALLVDEGWQQQKIDETFQKVRDAHGGVLPAYFIAEQTEKALARRPREEVAAT